MFSIMLVNKDTKIFYGNTEIKKIYLGSNLVWQRQTMDESTLAIINYANTNGYAIPSNLTAFDNLIKGMKSCGIWALLDRFWLFSGDGSTDFKRINLIDPSKTRADFYGGLTISASGIQGNGTNAYVDTNFNPSLLESGQKYKLNDAGIFYIINKNSTTSTVNKNFVLLGYLTGNPSNYQLSFQHFENGYQRFNNTAGFYKSINFLNLGLKGFSRTGSNILQVSKELQATNTQSPTALPAIITLLGQRGNSTYNNDTELGCLIIGASIPFQVSQDFRTVFNTYLTAIGQNPIA